MFYGRQSIKRLETDNWILTSKSSVLCVRMEFGSGIWIFFAITVLFQVWMGSQGETTQDGYSFQVDSSVIVIQEGLCVSIPCQFTANNRRKFTNSTGYWKMALGTAVASNDKSIALTKQNFHLVGDPNVGDCTLHIADATKQDSGTYFFRFEESKDSLNKFNYMANKITVQVTDLTQKPEIIVFGEMVAKEEVRMTCLLPGICSPPMIKWWRDNADEVLESTSMSITPNLWDHGISVTCEVSLPKVDSSTRQTLNLDVQYPPTIKVHTVIEPSEVTLENHTVSVKEGQSVILSCLVDSNPAADVTWTKGEKTIASSVTGQKLELYLAHVKPSDADTYSCTAQNNHGDTSDFVDIEVESSKVEPNDNLYADGSPDLEEVTAASPQQASRDIDYKLLAGLVAGNVLVLSLIALGLFCLVRRNMKRRQQGIINNGQELSSQGTASSYKGFNN
ncbi:sialic acid-binding Ig-like lectin 8 isoform X2 [Rana temporaria]|uniref:sialic acid-binding Ig-like lectin 8 isoform X2 n=1 Tax=Rana temporaria TaxID=8407 RepID=UPI001AAC6923|nr:sialic acid-binding Ig-like lectin 8 isoform X2 [Rana temporaria]